MRKEVVMGTEDRPAPVDVPQATAGEAAVPSTPDDRTLAMFCHLGGLLTGFILPLVLWLVRREQSPFMDFHGKEALNFQITILIYFLASLVLMFLIVGFFLMFGLAVFEIVVVILASVAAGQGRLYRYPLTIRFIK
jgi:hypothetical protein